MIIPVESELPQALETSFSGCRRLWRIQRRSDESEVVYLTWSLPVASDLKHVRDIGRLVGLKREGAQHWLKWSTKSRSWLSSSLPDHKLLEGLTIVGAISY